MSDNYKFTKLPQLKRILKMAVGGRSGGLINKSMTLQELMELGNKLSYGEISLSPLEENKLISTLKAYGEEVLIEGQILKEDNVTIMKTATGRVLVKILPKPN